MSLDRFQTYLQLAGYNRARALDLHEWNTRLNAALLHDFAHLEVGLRNFYDRALMAAVQPGDSHWTDQASFTALFPAVGGGDARTHGELSTARRNAGGPTAPPGKLLAELTFGFWVFLTSTRHTNLIWTPHLAALYPAGSQRGQIHPRPRRTPQGPQPRRPPRTRPRRRGQQADQADHPLCRLRVTTTCAVHPPHQHRERPAGLASMTPRCNTVGFEHLACAAAWEI
ncbi:hypothetical protein [Mycolicibacterium goodii]|uniref:hypothetical protein n=1 Tax=Mycolicibacterium goodii TaxID=134601 RepID=UPI00256F12B1|nr:hypothetical protein [Mycolicibacterium goodii]